MQREPSNPAGHEHGPKVAISRLDRPPPPSKANEHSREDRVARACKNCRKRKVRCSGSVPRCTNCHANGLTCTYEQARRDRLREATQLNESFVSLLRDLSLNASEEDKKKIEDALEKVEGELATTLPTQSPGQSIGKRSRNQSSPGEQESGAFGEACVTASVGSNEDLDYLEEDLMRSRQSRETGYVGQNSEVQWLRTVQRQAERTSFEPHDMPYGPPGKSQDAFEKRSNALHERRQNSKPSSMQHITDSTFYLDSDNIEVDFAVNPYELPDPHTAEQLLDCYMNTVHTSFPILPNNFYDQLRKFIQSLRQNMAFEVPVKWRALMNLLFAIGARYSHLIGAKWRGDQCDHLIYMTRAIRLLELKNTVMFISGPDLLLVQTTGTLSLYFLVIGHVSRAWVMIGVSLRLALALGLHLRNEDPMKDQAQKESLLRTWWSLHSVECLLSSITGRPPVIAVEDCTAPLPQATPGEQTKHNTTSRRNSRKRTGRGTPRTPSSIPSNSHSKKRAATKEQYFVDHIKIALINQKVLVDEYSPRTAVQSWEYLQNKISDLLIELEDWARVTFSDDNKSDNSNRQQEFEREQFLLGMYYWSTKILITRPCLCRIERRIRHESHDSATFNAKTGDSCVDAALQMAGLLPDVPDINFIYSRGPWWTIVHNLMQALAVLLLEVALRGSQPKANTDEILVCIKKLIRWLRAMRTNDPVAARAYQVIWKILKNSAPSLQERADELFAEDEEEGGEVHHQNEDQGEENNELDHPTPSQPHLTDFFTQGPPVDHWPYGNGLTPSSINTGQFDHSFFQQPPMNPIPEYENPYFIPEQPYMPMMFGNPFVTSFDEGAPVVNMQDLWLSLAGPSRDAGLAMSDMEVSHDDSQHAFFEPMTNYPEPYEQYLSPQQHQHQHQQ